MPTSNLEYIYRLKTKIQKLTLQLEQAEDKDYLAISNDIDDLEMQILEVTDEV